MSDPLPIDNRLIKLKLIVDNAYLSYYSHIKHIYPVPKINLTTQPFPSIPNRLSSNANVIFIYHR